MEAGSREMKARKEPFVQMNGNRLCDDATRESLDQADCETESASEAI